MMNRLKTYLAALALASISPLPLGAQATISTEAYTYPVLGIPFPAIGQSFTTPDATNTRLETFRIGFGFMGTSPTEQIARLVEWDPIQNRIVGEALFQSAAAPAEDILEYPYHQYITFSLGGISLSPQSSYLFFLSLAVEPTDPNIPGYYAVLPTTPYRPRNDVYRGGGAFLTATNLFQGVDGDASWERLYLDAEVDLGFTAEFSPETVTPEPASLTLLGTGLAAMAGALRRRRRKGEASSEI